jgi:osmoprotectant transport system permease protein
MTLIAIAIGFVIAFMAALLAYRWGRLELPFANVSALFYTIPSIAYFQIMVPITGIGWLSIEIALVSYTLLILFRNTLTGLKEVPVDAKEAAEGMGLTRAQTLMRIELAGPAGHRGGSPRRDGHDDLARHDRGVHHAARARGADLQRAANRRQHRVRRRKPPRHRAGADRRRADRRAAVVAHAVGAGTEAVVVSDLVNFFVEYPGLLAEKAVATLAISALAIGIALVLALPVGVLLGHKHRGSYAAINVSNVLRALPSLALIAISLAIFGLSSINILVALVALAVPPILTNAYTAVDNVDPDAVEAARGMGMREREIVGVIELPLSWPLIFAGIRTGAVYVIATTPLAAIAGGGGLGDIIVNQPTYRMAGVIAATIVVVALAFAVDGLLGLVQRKLTPTGLTAPTELQILPLTNSEHPSAEKLMATN